MGQAKRNREAGIKRMCGNNFGDALHPNRNRTGLGTYSVEETPMTCEGCGSPKATRHDLDEIALYDGCHDLLIDAMKKRVAQMKCTVEGCTNQATCEPEVGMYLCDPCYEIIGAAVLDKLVEEGKIPHRFHSSVNECEGGNA